eukprot:scaffold98213_cov52-Phaeocystis_antarctica.AAC.2
MPVGRAVRLLHAHCARHQRPEARASRVRLQQLLSEGRVARRRRVVPWRGVGGVRYSGCCEKRRRRAGDQSAPVSVTARGPSAGCASWPSQPQKPMTVRVGRTPLAAGPGQRNAPPPHEAGMMYGRRAAQPVSSQRRWCGSAIVSKPRPGASNDEQQPRGPGACQAPCRPTRRVLHSGRSAMSHTMVGKHSNMAPAVAAAVAWLHVSLRCLLRAACSTLGDPSLGTADHELPNTAPRARSSKLRVGSEADEFEWARPQTRGQHGARAE